MKAPNTTVLGILMLIGAGVQVAQTFFGGMDPNWPAIGTQILGGVGLIKAADQKKP